MNEITWEFLTFFVVFQNQEKEENSKTVFQIQDEIALKEEFDNLKKEHSIRYLPLTLTVDCIS